MSARKPYVRQLVDDRWLIAVVVLVELAAALSLISAVQTTFHCVQNGVPIEDPSMRGRCDVEVTSAMIAWVVSVLVATVLLAPLFLRRERQEGIT